MGATGVCQARCCFPGVGIHLPMIYVRIVLWRMNGKYIKRTRKYVTGSSEGVAHYE